MCFSFSTFGKSAAKTSEKKYFLKTLLVKVKQKQVRKILLVKALLLKVLQKYF
jgi:hypothetical protein